MFLAELEARCLDSMGISRAEPHLPFPASRGSESPGLVAPPLSQGLIGASHPPSLPLSLSPISFLHVQDPDVCIGPTSSARRLSPRSAVGSPSSHRPPQSLVWGSRRGRPWGHCSADQSHQGSGRSEPWRWAWMERAGLGTWQRTLAVGRGQDPACGPAGQWAGGAMLSRVHGCACSCRGPHLGRLGFCQPQGLFSVSGGQRRGAGLLKCHSPSPGDHADLGSVRVARRQRCCPKTSL